MVAAAAAVALVTSAGCRTAQTDGNPPREALLEGRGQRAGPSGGGAGDSCFGPLLPGVQKTPFLRADPTNPEHHRQISKHLDRLCFGYKRSEENHRVFPDTSADSLTRSAVWLQNELRMRNADPRELVDGEGVVVAKIRNATNIDIQFAKWGSALPSGADAYLWFGMKQGKPYSMAFWRDASGAIQILSSDPAASWEHDTTPKSREIRVNWDPHAHDKPRDMSLRARLQEPGSGWVSCKAGCCTALDAIVPQ